MKKINLIVFSSALHDNASVMNSREPLFQALRDMAELNITYPSTLATRMHGSNGVFSCGDRLQIEFANTEDSRTVCFIATGGTEEMFRQYLDILPRPVILLSDGLHNSLAASFEISTYLDHNHIECCLLNAPLDYNPNYFKTLEQKIFGEIPPIQSDDLSSKNRSPYFDRADRRVLSRKKIGLFGNASSWLISSAVDREYMEKEYDVKFIDIQLDELIDEYKLVAPDEKPVKQVCMKMENLVTEDRDAEELNKAARLYVAFRNLCGRYQLSALTVKCFGILDECRTTACLALALLNDDGIVAGCEGDIPALWTMMYAKEILGKQAFMANPSSSNRAELTIDFAHCTIPLGMVHGYRLPSHFESSTGIGIAGSMPSGRYRIIKFSGNKLDRFYSVEGNVLMNTNVPQRCRTQLRFKFDSEADYNGFFTTSKGNHIILIAL